MTLDEFYGFWMNDDLSDKRVKETFEKIAKELSDNPGMTDIEYYSDFLTHYQDMITLGDFSFNEGMAETLAAFIEVEMDDGFGTEGMRL